MYAAAKQAAAAYHDPERIWTEHERHRSAVLAPTQAVTPDLVTQAAALWQRALAKGIIPPQSGAN